MMAPDDAYLSLEVASTTPAQRYKLYMGSVIPRPIAFVTTQTAAGEVNVAPFSNFMVVSSAENLLVFSVGKDRDNGRSEKDTLSNARQAGEFVVNTVPFSLVRQVQQCAEYFPPHVSEVTVAGLTLLPSKHVAVPRIAESKVQFECRLHKIERFGDSHLVFGEVLLAHVRKEVFDDYKIRLEAYAPAGRIGGRVYCSLGDLVEV
jgi:flavin reductase (DIM6/NTAB) family NADH-FMN oxidoreductase RutF